VCALVNTKIIGALVLIIILSVMGLFYYKNKADGLHDDLITLKAASEQIFADKQAEVNTITTRANEYLRKAQNDYDKVSVNRNSADVNRRVQQVRTIETDPMRTIQKPAIIFETRSSGNEKADIEQCEFKYRQLWHTWQDLCLIYGCVD
jgi:Tfp pilus assembly protein PilE